MRPEHLFDPADLPSLVEHEPARWCVVGWTHRTSHPAVPSPGYPLRQPVSHVLGWAEGYAVYPALEAISPHWPAMEALHEWDAEGGPQLLDVLVTDPNATHANPEGVS